MSSFSEFLSEDTLWDYPKLSCSPVPGRYIHLCICFCGYLTGVRQTQRLAQHRAHSAVLYRNTCWAESKGVRIHAKKTSHSIVTLNGIVTTYTASSFFPESSLVLPCTARAQRLSPACFQVFSCLPHFSDWHDHLPTQLLKPGN